VCAPFDDGEERGYTFNVTGTYRRLGVPTLVNVGGGPNRPAPDARDPVAC
jgi:hypothetical protein